MFKKNPPSYIGIKKKPIKPKRKARRLSKRPRPKRGRKELISRSEARRRAERFVLNRIFKRGQARDGARVPLHVGFSANRTKKDVWVVYKKLPPFVLQSSEVILVCKRTGRIIYEGSANDEG